MDTRQPAVEKLTASTYGHWKFEMKVYLVSRDLWDIVEGTEKLKDNATEKVKKEFRKRQQAAWSSICLSVSRDLQIYVRNTNTAQEAWDNLANHFQEKTLSSKISLRRKLYDAKMENNGSMEKHINNIKTIAEELEAIEDEQSEKDLVFILMSSVPCDYRNLITTLETLKEERLTWGYVRDRLLTEHERMKKFCAKGEERDFPNDDALFVGDSDRGHRGQSRGDQYWKKKIECHYCQEKGHFQYECKKKKIAEEERGKREKNETAAFCNDSQGEQLVEEFSSFGFSPEIALHVDVHEEDGGEWCLDSGSSYHMSGVRSDFNELLPLSSPIAVSLADDNTIPGIGVGSVGARIFDADDKVTPISFKNVLYVPGVKKRLLSIPQITDKGGEVTFKKNEVELKFSGRCYKFGKRDGKLYKLNNMSNDSVDRKKRTSDFKWEKKRVGVKSSVQN